MKKNLFILPVFILLLIACNQIKEGETRSSDKNQTEAIKADTIVNKKTKMELFTSKTGAILKFIDFNLPKLNTIYSSLETHIRKVESGTDLAYFYQIGKKGAYSTTTASIEYSDLLEIIKAFAVLKIEENKDIALNPDYLENKFVTVDGFQVGYYISKGKSTWFIKLERYGSDNTVFVDDVNVLETAFIEAKNKIEELKK